MKRIGTLFLAIFSLLILLCSHDKDDNALGPDPNPGTAPAAPTGLRAQVVWGTDVMLSWNNSAGADSYLVCRQNSSADTFDIIAITPNIFYNDTSLNCYYNALMQFTYKILAVNSAGYSSPSDTVIIWTSCQYIYMRVQGEGASATSIRLWWAWQDSLTRFVIGRAPDSTDDFDSIGGTSDTFFIDQGLQTNTFWKYSVCAISPIGKFVCSPAILATTLPTQPNPPQNVSITYDGTWVDISWTAPTGAFDYYRVYRTTRLDASGKPDTTTLTASVAGYRISKDSLHFREEPGLADGVYYYTVRSVADNAFESAESNCAPAWPGFPSCTVGVVFNFGINNGDVFASSPQCVLNIKDPWLRLVSVRFTQIAAAYRDSAHTIRFTGDTVASIQYDDYNQLKDLITSGFVPSLQDTTPVFSVPMFDTVDALNSMAGYQLGTNAVNSFPWVLRGIKEKMAVFAEITYKTSPTGPVITDTILDLIEQARHSVDIGFRNSGAINHPNVKDTMERVYPNDTSIKISAIVIYGNTMQFTVDINNDSTLDQSFECWAMLSPEGFISSDFFRSRMSSNSIWCMTKPTQYSLSAVNGSYNPQTSYIFSLDTTTSEGYAAVQYLLRAKNTTLYPPTPTLSVDSNYKILNYIPASWWDAEGKKQILFVLRYKDKHFNTSHLAIFGYENGQETKRLYRDTYLPIMKIQPDPRFNPDHIGNDSVITSVFNFALDTVSISDSGWAAIEEAKLIIARKPDNLQWAANVTWSTITYADLAAMPNYEYPFPIANPAFTIKRVRWDNIDPANWPSGSYIMGVITKDEFGNTGFPKVYKSIGDKGTNPWLVNIQTGQ